MLCVFLHTTVTLALAGFAEWSVNHLYGPFPTTDTWGYYRSDVPCVYGSWFDRVHIIRLHAWARARSVADQCRSARALTALGLQTAAAWKALSVCFHA